MIKYTIEQIKSILDAWEIIKDCIIINDNLKTAQFAQFLYNGKLGKLKKAIELTLEEEDNEN